MSLDLQQFHSIFFEESREHITELERLLLGMDPSAPDPETINAVFRAAHSLKGESAAIGFNEISRFSHTLESYLDLVRQGERLLDADATDRVLEAVDCIRMLVDSRETGNPPDDAFVVRVEAAILELQGLSPAAGDDAPAQFAAGPTDTSGTVPGEAPRDASIRVATGKIDSLVDLVSELVITQGMLARLREREALQDDEDLRAGLDMLERNTREIQDCVMGIRMFPLHLVFQRFPRPVRDLARQLGKQVQLVTEGGATECDKAVIEKIGDPMMHLVRNALDHGLEPPGERVAAGKPATGTLRIQAAHRSGQLVIDVEDDGRGLDTQAILARAREKRLLEPEARPDEEEIHELIFLPDFSSATEVSELSGRGVVMDVVKRNIEELHGHLEVRSTPGHGCRFRIRLPLTMAILDGQLLDSGGVTFVLPMVAILESLQARVGTIRKLAGACDVYPLRGDFLPVVNLAELFGLRKKLADTAPLMVVVEADGERLGVVVDQLGAQQQVVIKSIEENYGVVPGISGATILGDGSVALIIDVRGLIQLAGATEIRRQLAALDAAAEQDKRRR